MVDELQDTNRVQLELIETIADATTCSRSATRSSRSTASATLMSSCSSGEASSWRRSKRRERLQTNFRSRPEILDGAQRRVRDRARIQLQAAGRRAGRPPAPDEPSVELLLVDKGADWELEGLAAPWRLAEAQALARRIAELVAAGTAPGEIVVLLRATTDMRAYERALERRGLPTYVIGGRGYWLHPQVLDIDELPAGTRQPARRGGAVRGPRITAGGRDDRCAGGARRRRHASAVTIPGGCCALPARSWRRCPEQTARRWTGSPIGSRASGRRSRAAGSRSCSTGRLSETGYDLEMLAHARRSAPAGECAQADAARARV